MSACKPIYTPNGTPVDGTSTLLCPPTTNWANCRPWDIESDAVNCLSTSTVDETLALGGTTLNIFKLLGIHEQNLTSDQYRFGNPISGGSDAKHPASEAFTKARTSWKSNQRGSDISKSYIGYDFGEILLYNGRRRYGVDANYRVQVNMVKLKQSSDPKARVSKVRLERSDDNKVWYGVHVLNLLDNDELNTYHIPNSIPNRYWRLRPMSIGIGECKQWEVQAIEFLEHDVTDITNVQDKIWLENRNREYSTNPIGIKGLYTPFDTQMNMSGFGVEIGGGGNYYSLKTTLTQCIAALGRPIVVGDIIELPAEAMITRDLNQQRLYLEVFSVGWDSTSMTHGWQHTMLLLIAKPAIAAEETQDIFGDKVPYVDESGLSNIFDGQSEAYQDYASVTQAIRAESNTQVPERGIDVSGTLRQFDESDVKRVDNKALTDQYNLIKDRPRNKLFSQDGMPPNGLDYTEGPEFPSNPYDGDYHRLNYLGTAKDIPTKLYQFSSIKNRWMYKETDMREFRNNQNNLLSEYVDGSNPVSPTKKDNR